MSRPRKYLQDNDQEILHPPITARSPLRRAPCNQGPQNKSPIRSRTPTRPVSPLKHQHALPNTIRYIAHVSPLRDRPSEADNYNDLSNGKNMRYIHNSKIERNFETNRKNDFNKPSDRTFPEENRLFGKIVDKLFSEKKGAPGSNNSHKTSLFADAEAKPRVDPSLRPSGTFKQLVSLAKAGETKSDIKPRSKGREDAQQNQAEEENLSCLVYRVRNLKGEEGVEERQASQISNHCSPPVQRKPSQTDNALPLQSIDYYKEVDILLDKVRGESSKLSVCRKQEESVRGSVSVRESLSMDPFL